MSVRVGINGFGRMGRLVVCALREHPELELAHVNEVKGGLATAAHLLEFDTVHGRFPGDAPYGRARRQGRRGDRASPMKLRNYALVTAGYWVFTVTDGALRMLVLLHFNELGYSPVAIAFLFLAYEFMGILTNLLGGWVGSRRGLNRTLVAGLGVQIVALSALTFESPAWQTWLSVTFVMAMQALAGVAKDLTKMSSKSAVKTVAGDGSLFRLVAILTGSKNALKGVGFFVGAALLTWVGYDGALWLMAGALAITVVGLLIFLDEDIGKSKAKAPLRSILSKSPAINRLSAARFFLFGARDIWFVVALPVFLADQLGWADTRVGGFLAIWVIGYGVVQSFAPRIVARGRADADEVVAAQRWALTLALVTGVMAVLVAFDIAVEVAVIGGLIVFGAVFAMNSSLHSFLVLAFSDDDGVALDVGFYYSANAAGRLMGTLLSGVLYLWGGLAAAMWGSAVFVVLTWLLALRLAPLGEHTQARLAAVAAVD